MTVRVMPSYRRMDRELVAAIAHMKRKRIAVQLVCESVALVTGLSMTEVLGARRTQHATYARHLFWYALSEHSRIGPTEIGRMFGGRDHATVIAGVRRIELERTTRTETARDVEQLARALRGAIS